MRGVEEADVSGRSSIQYKWQTSLKKAPRAFHQQLFSLKAGSKKTGTPEGGTSVSQGQGSDATLGPQDGKSHFDSALSAGPVQTDRSPTMPPREPKEGGESSGEDVGIIWDHLLWLCIIFGLAPRRQTIPL